MIIAAINAWTVGSTGQIMCDISVAANQQGHKTFLFSKAWINQDYRKLENHKEIGDYFLNRVHIKLAYYSGLHGCFSILPTLKLIRELKSINPDLIHLHNLHGWYINLLMLFRYIKTNDIRVVWTLHDCWSFTGYCPHFDMEECDKWKNGCYDCPRYSEYPQSLVDRSKTMYNLKKKWFTGVENLTIVTPSDWLSKLVKQSYLKDYPIKIINNGIDLSVFKPTENNLRKSYNLQNKIVILGVSFDWGKRKGLDIFIELASRLDDRFQIVLVGTDDDIDKQLAKNIISIHRINNQQELAEIYSFADIFVNPTREENFPTVNIEALACGIPVITFNTGGSPEIIDETCGVVVEKNDLDAILKEIVRVGKDKPFSFKACIKRAEKYNKNNNFKRYIELYENSEK